jgi:hypothetical protein
MERWETDVGQRPHHARYVGIFEGEGRREAFLRLNRTGTVPAGATPQPLANADANRGYAPDARETGRKPGATP